MAGFLRYIVYTMVSAGYANAFNFSYWYWGYFSSVR